MVWFFDRDDQHVEVETRFDNDTLEYVLAVRWPDGHANVERHPDAESFRTRVMALDRELKSMNWRNTGSPALLPEGWVNKRVTH
jgi:hypothetical protein